MHARVTRAAPRGRYLFQTAKGRRRAALISLFAALAFWGPSPGFAETRVEVDGKGLYGWCRTDPQGLPNPPVGGYCAGFIHGVVDVHGEGTTLYGHRTCLPRSITIRQLRTIVVTWLERHPDKQHQIAHGLVGEALSEAYPCE